MIWKVDASQLQQNIISLIAINTFLTHLHLMSNNFLLDLDQQRQNIKLCPLINIDGLIKIIYT